jgi:hypothetical protein
MTRSTFRLIRFGSAKTLTQANLDDGPQEGIDPTNKWGVGG